MTASLPGQTAYQLNDPRLCQMVNRASQEDLDEITSLAAYSCQTKIALLHLIDSQGQKLKSKIGLGIQEAYQCQIFYNQTLGGSDILIVPDTLADERFATNPIVLYYPKIRFYAGISLVTNEGLTLGTLSVMDYVPRDLTWEQKQVLKTLSRLVVTQKLFPKTSSQRPKVINMKEMLPEIPSDIVEIFESITDAFFTLDRDWRFTYLNSRAEQVLLRTKKELIGKSIWDEFPEAIGSVFETECQRAVTKRVTVHFEQLYRPLGIWLEVRAYPYKGGLSVYFRDVTARKKSEAMLMERTRLSAFTAEVGITLGHGGALTEILNRCTQIMVEHLDITNACIWTVSQESEKLALQALAFARDRGAENKLENLYGQNEKTSIATACDFIRPDSSIVDFVVQTRQPYLANILGNQDRDRIKIWLQQVGLHADSNVKAFVAYPLIVEERLVGALALLACESFSPEANDMLEWVANAIAVAIDRTWARSELLSRRESLLFRLASQIRNSLDLDTILDTAVHEIRSLLQIDRCHFLWCWPDSQHPSLTVTHESCNSNLPSLLADYPIEKVTSLLHKIQRLETIRVDNIAHSQNLDEQEKELLNSLGVVSQLLIPLETHSGQLGAVVCSHCSGSRPWSESEVELLKAVVDQLAIAIDQAELFAQTRATAFAAQSQAQQLEGAIQHLKQTEAQLVQNEKMSSLGQMVAGIAHEINNPINFIYGNVAHAANYIEDLIELLNLYQKNYPQPVKEIQQQAEDIDLSFLIDDLPKLLSSMQVGTERIRQIVLSLRNFSRLDEAEKKPVDIHEGIDSTLLILQNRLKGGVNKPEIQIIKEYGNLPLVECYAGQLNQVFMNIISNAIDALENKAEPRIITIQTSIGMREWGLVNRVEEMEGKVISAASVLPPVRVSPCILIKIRDNGQGMTEEIRKRLFDPFFTTKPVGKGTGLGLSISYQIVTEKHGGQLRCISSPGQGAEFIIEIPISIY